MPPIISFAWTTPSLLAGRKTCTRRDWDASYARRFRAGMEVLAYDRSQRAGGKPIARLRLTHDVTHEPDAGAPDSDYEAEGFAWFCERYGGRLTNGRDVSWEAFETWRRTSEWSYVIRFKVIEYLRGPLAKDGA